MRTDAIFTAIFSQQSLEKFNNNSQKIIGLSTLVCFTMYSLRLPCLKNILVYIAHISFFKDNFIWKEDEIEMQYNFTVKQKLH